jgi:hypothetical protein
LIAEVRISDYKLQTAEENVIAVCGYAIVVKHLLTSCVYAGAEVVLSSGCGIAIADIKK